jgi:hypothetical protein
VVIDEVKTHQRGPGIILRSQSPEMAEQELWGLLLTHYGIHRIMTEAADQAEIDPDRLSFIRSLRVIHQHVTSQAGFPPTHLDGAVAEAIAEITERPNPKRRQRTYPRVVKRHQRSGYKVKKDPLMLVRFTRRHQQSKS